MSFLLAFLCELKFFIGHISNKSLFPKPLSKSEEKKYLERYFEGDDSAYDKLIEHNMRLVAHIAKKYASDRYELDDLISIGSIGLIKAVRSFDKGKSTHLVTYASRCIDNEILMHLRSTKKQKNEVSINEPIGIDKEGNEVSLIDVLFDENENVSDSVETKMEICDMFVKMKHVLDTREKNIIILRYGIGGRKPLTQRETSKILGISRSYVSRIEKAALEKMKN